MTTKPSINLESLTIEDVKALSPQDIANKFNAQFVGVMTNPTPAEWISGTVYHIYTGANSSTALSPASHKKYMESGNFIIFGTTKENHWKLLLPCVDGKFLPPGSLSVDHYKPFLSQSGFSSMAKQVAEYNAQTRLTDLLNPVLPEELVGKDSNYTVLKQPSTPAYPKGDEFSYSDAYTSQLNTTYSLETVLGNKVKDQHFASLVMGSPLRNSEGEYILVHMLRNSVQAGSWQPFVIDVPQLTDTSIKTAQEYLERVQQKNTSSTGRMMDAGTLFGVAKAMNGGFTLPIAYDNKLIVIPSQEFVEYISQQK